MKNKLVFSLIMLATMFPDWSSLLNLIATAMWLWLPQFHLNWRMMLMLTPWIAKLFPPFTTEEITTLQSLKMLFK